MREPETAPKTPGRAGKGDPERMARTGCADARGARAGSPASTRVGASISRLAARLSARFTLLALPLATLCAFAPRPARADLVVIQDSNGFPGGGEVEEAHQKVFLGEERLRVLDERHGWALYVLLDKRVVREASSAEKTYIEKPFSDYQKIREKREATRAGKVAEYQKELAKARTDAERRELKQALERMGLREDATTQARTDRFDETRPVSIVVNGVKKDFKAEHVVVRENEGPPVFDIWLCPGLARPESVFKFYQEIGTFSEPVIREVLKLVGFPVEISATVDDGNNRKTFRTKILEVRDERVEPIEYEIPAGWRQVQANAPAAGAAGGAAKTYKCEICGKECAPGSGDGSLLWRDPFSGARHPVCGDQHRKEIIQKLAAQQRGEAPPPPPSPEPRNH